MSSQRELEKTQKAIDTIREDIEQVTSKWGEKQKFILKLMEKRNTMLNSIDATRVGKYNCITTMYNYDTQWRVQSPFPK